MKSWSVVGQGWLVLARGALGTSLALLGCSNGDGTTRGQESLGAAQEALAVPAGATGFGDVHEDGNLRGWTSVGARRWVEKSGALTTLSPGSLAKVGGSRSGFLISEYPSADDGTFEAVMTADEWNGDAGGTVLRWSSPKSFYYITVKPANQWSSQLVFNVNSMDPSKGKVVAEKFTIGKTFKLKVVTSGATFRIYLDDVLRATVVDRTNSYGRVGFAHSDNWENLLQVQQTTWIDVAGSNPRQPVDPQAGKVELKVHVRDDGYGQANMLKPKLYVENTGEVTVSDFSAYYLFTAEPGKTPVLEDWWTPESTPTLLPLGGGQYAIEYHFSALELAPGELTPSPDGNLVGVHYTDWSPLNKLDDFSNPSGSAWQLSSTIPIEGAFKPNSDFTGATEPIIKLVGGSVPSRVVNMKRLKLTRLRCIDTTDDDDYWGGEDHVAVSVELDGQSVKTINAGGMDETGDQDDDDPKNYYFNGNGGHDNEYLEFQADAKISIFDYEDISFDVFRVSLLNLDTTDFIGSNVLDVSPGSHQVRFNRDGKYDLYYTVEEFDESKTFATLADYQLQRFAESTKPGVWPTLSKAQLLADMRSRLSLTGPTPGYTLVYQGDLGYCGPAATTYWLLKNRPLRYLIFTREVFENGVYYGPLHDYVASDDLRACKMPTSKSINNQADWLVMSTLSDNFAYGRRQFTVNVTRPPTPAVTFEVGFSDERIHPDANGYPRTPRFKAALKDTGNKEMFYWFKDVLGYNYVDDESTFVWGEDELLHSADKVVKNGGAAVLGVDNEFWHDGTDTGYGPNHYVAFLGNLEATYGSWYEWNTDHYKFRYWNWAKELDNDLDEPTMEAAVFGGTLSR